MPSAIKHDHELSSKGLVSVLMERQGADQGKLEAFLWKMFPDNDCFACVSGSVPTPDFNGIPHGVLIGVDGKLLWDGSPLGEAKKLQELIAAELEKVKKGWGETADHKKVRAALYGRGDLFGAQAVVTAMAEGEARTKLQAEIDARFATAKKAIDNLKGSGQWAKAHDAAKKLQKGVGTKAEWTAEVTTILADFATDAGKAELAAEAKLEKVVKQLRDKKREPAIKALQALVKSAGQTKVGERAQRTLTALETPAQN